MIGGFLSDPAGHYPSLFGEIDFFVNFPYALPCIVTGSISIIGSIVIDPVAIVHPMTGGKAPAAPPMTIFCGVFLLSQIV